MSEPAHTIRPSRSAEIPEVVLTDLEQVETRLRAELASRETRLEEIGLHLIGAGGKRVRPLVVLLAFHAASSTGSPRRRRDAIEVAVALELIHSATLLHDDIIDANQVRRGRPSALEQFGLADSLIAGDYLFCRAFALCARFEPQVIRWAGQACVSLTEGEVLQSRFRHNTAVTLDDYREIIERKTAVLFATGARAAAHVADVDEATVDLMQRCGRHLGLAFQMRDDLLDVDGREALTGKPQGLDLRDGNPSMPIVLAMPGDQALQALFTAPHPAEAEIEAGLARIRASGVLTEIESAVQRQSALGLECLAGLPPSPSQAALVELVRSLDARVT